MSDNKWITDRLPTEEDADDHGYVWITDKNGNVWHTMWDCVHQEPWMHFTRPEPYVEPYVEPKRFVAIYFEHSETWCVIDRHSAEPGLPNRFNSRETAERIAEIFNEVNE